MRFLIPALNAHLKRIAIAGSRRHVRNALTCGLVALGIAAPVSAQQVVDWADFSSPTSAAYPGGGNVTVTIASSYRRDGSSVPYTYMAGYPQVDAAPVEELAALEATSPFQTQFPFDSIGPRSAMVTWNTSTNVGTMEHVLTMDFPAVNRAGGDTLVGLGGVYPNVSGPNGSRVNSRWIVTATRCNGTAETNYSGWTSIIPPAGFTATDGAAGAIFSTPVTGAATSGGYVVSVGTLSTYTGNQDAVPALVRPPAGTCYSRITITRTMTSTGTVLPGTGLPGGGSTVDTDYFKLYIGKVLDAGILRLRKSLPHGRAVSGNQFQLRIAGGTGADVVATTSGTTNTPTQVATLEPALAGTAYTLSEAAAGSPATVLSNYRTTYACTNTRPGGQTPSGSGTSFSVTPAANDDLTCTFTNSRIATLRLRKELPNGRSVAGDQFRLAIAGTDAPAAVTTTGSGTTATGTVTHTTATAGSTYTLSETGASGAVLGNYATTYSCTNARSGGQTPSGSDTTFEVIPVAGDDLTCTFSNALRPRVTIRKTSVGGTGSFTFSGSNGIANQTIATATAGTPVAGAVQMLTSVGVETTITEGAPPAGFALTDIACTGLPSGGTATPNLATRTVTLNAAATAAGANVTCTFTNTRPTQLTLIKTVTNDNGGTQPATAWTLSAAGPTNISGATGAAAVTNATVNPGTYTLTESATPTGYTASSYSCVKNGGAAVVSNNITLAAGDTATCTINNNDRPATLTLVKTVTNDNGGTQLPTAWTLSAAGPTNISGATGSTAVTNATVNPGAYTLSESATPTGYTASSYSCVRNGGAAVVSNSITLAAGDVATCTINNNDRPATLTLVKTVTNDNGGTQLPTAWTLSAAGPTNISGATGSTAVTNATVNPGAYTLSESATPTGYTASTYSCVRNGGAAVVSNSITLAAGDVATCTINNNDRPATLTLVKTVTNDNGGTQLPTAWTLSAAGPTNISGATGAAAVTNATVNPGTYTLSESATPTGYTASSYSCVKNGGAAVVGNNITLAAGDVAACTINNNDSNQTDVSITKVASADTVVRGDEVVFTLVVRNPGVAAATGTVVRDPAVAGLDCTAAGLAVPTCSATGGASCPTPLTATGLQAGVAIPALPAGSTVSIGLTCRATASGMP